MNKLMGHNMMAARTAMRTCRERARDVSVGVGRARSRHLEQGVQAHADRILERSRPQVAPISARRRLPLSPNA